MKVFIRLLLGLVALLLITIMSAVFGVGGFLFHARAVRGYMVCLCGIDTGSLLLQLPDSKRVIQIHPKFIGEILYLLRLIKTEIVIFS